MVTSCVHGFTPLLQQLKQIPGSYTQPRMKSQKPISICKNDLNATFDSSGGKPAVINKMSLC